MPEVSATEAARSFADILDAVEHRGEHFTVVRRGKPIAHLEPARPGLGADAKALLRRHQPDASWSEELSSLRRLVEVDVRS
ncbi:MAG: type II toxin-antitoxin system Phd/YefM family antitoxin [Acidimicrobiales bacterium]